MYQCKHFKIEELVPKSVFEQAAGHTYKLWMIFDPLFLITQDALRKRYDQIVINSWLWNGNFQFSGYRPPGCGVGARFSQHRFGRAGDNKFESVTAEEVRKDILSMTYEERKRLGLHHIRRIELGTDWFHFDTGNTGLSETEIFTFKP